MQQDAAAEAEGQVADGRHPEVADVTPTMAQSVHTRHVLGIIAEALTQKCVAAPRGQPDIPQQGIKLFGVCSPISTPAANSRFLKQRATYASRCTGLKLHMQPCPACAGLPPGTRCRQFRHRSTVYKCRQYRALTRQHPGAAQTSCCSHRWETRTSCSGRGTGPALRGLPSACTSTASQEDPS